jgi:hypothetical protein
MIRPADFFCGGKKRKREKKREIVSAEMLVPRGIFLLIINPVFDLIFTRPTTGKREKKNWTTDKKSTSWTRGGKKMLSVCPFTDDDQKKNSVSQPTTHRLELGNTSGWPVKFRSFLKWQQQHQGNEG